MKIYICSRCGVEKDSEHGICSECGRFPLSSRLCPHCLGVGLVQNELPSIGATKCSCCNGKGVIN
jgi:predicted ATP-dependent serine protease